MHSETVKREFFVAGGTLHHDVPSYVERPADRELRKLASTGGQLYYVLTTRQMGKSSLMIRTAKHLQVQGVHTAIIDLTSIGTISIESWYITLLDELQGQLNLNIEVEIWWEKRSSLSPVKRFSKFVGEVIPKNLEGLTVIFIDEVDSALRLDFSDDFFAAVRAIYNRETSGLGSGLISFVLLGVTTPNVLIRDQLRTPFNVGTSVRLEELELGEAQRVLAKGFLDHGETILERIFYWTNGHPYLTQKIAKAITGNSKNAWNKQAIDRIVEELFLTDRARFEDSNLQFVRNRLLSSPYRDDLLSLYRQVFNGENAVENDDRSTHQDELKLYGLVRVNETGYLAVRNRIYRRVFDSIWIEKLLQAGRYRTIDILAQGGAWTTYLAVDTRLGDRHVVLREMDFVALSPADQSMAISILQHEASLLAQLSHHGIAKVIDFFEERGYWYLVMEYVHGETLEDVIRRIGRFSEAQVLTWTGQLAEILDYLHRRDPPIMHGDMRPTSLTVQTDGTLKLTGFGTSRFIRSRKTVSLGTPGYVAPEQFGQGQTDERSDVYSFAVLLHQLLTGIDPREHPFNFVPVEDLRSEVSPRVASAINRALQIDPSKRFSSVRAFADALGARLLYPTSSDYSQPSPGLEPTQLPKVYSPFMRANTGSSARWPLYSAFLGILCIVLTALSSIVFSATNSAIGPIVAFATGVAITLVVYKQYKRGVSRNTVDTNIEMDGAKTRERYPLTPLPHSRSSLDTQNTDSFKIQKYSRFCPNCGVIARSDAVFCISCGFRLAAPEKDPD